MTDARWIAVCASLGLAPAAQAQLPPLLDERREIALARSAAPAELSRAASVYVLRRGGHVEVVKGTNGAACLVARDHPESLYPICYDPEGARSILAVQLERQRLREQRLHHDSIEPAILRGFTSGRFEIPTRAAVAYMMSPHQIIYAGASGRRVGAWFPHLMIYMPNSSVPDIAMVGLPNGDLTLDDAGKPTAHWVVMTRDWAVSEPLPEERPTLAAQPGWLCAGDPYVLRWSGGTGASLSEETAGAPARISPLRGGLQSNASATTVLRALDAAGAQLASDTISLHPVRMEHNLVRPAASCAGRLSVTSMAIPPAHASDRIRPLNVTNRGAQAVLITHRGVTVRLAPGESTDRFNTVPFSGDWVVLVETGAYNPYCPVPVPSPPSSPPPAPRIDVLIVTACR